MATVGGRGGRNGINGTMKRRKGGVNRRSRRGWRRKKGESEKRLKKVRATRMGDGEEEKRKRKESRAKTGREVIRKQGRKGRRVKLRCLRALMHPPPKQATAKPRAPQHLLNRAATVSHVEPSSAGARTKIGPTDDGDGGGSAFEIIQWGRTYERAAHPRRPPSTMLPTMLFGVPHGQPTSHADPAKTGCTNSMRRPPSAQRATTLPAPREPVLPHPRSGSYVKRRGGSYGHRITPPARSTRADPTGGGAARMQDLQDPASRTTTASARTTHTTQRPPEDLAAHPPGPAHPYLHLLHVRRDRSRNTRKDGASRGSAARCSASCIDATRRSGPYLTQCARRLRHNARCPRIHLYPHIDTSTSTPARSTIDERVVAPLESDAGGASSTTTIEDSVPRAARTGGLEAQDYVRGCPRSDAPRKRRVSPHRTLTRTPTPSFLHDRGGTDPAGGDVMKDVRLSGRTTYVPKPDTQGAAHLHLPHTDPAGGWGATAARVPQGTRGFYTIDREGGTTAEAGE
ncbi:hypothetical protein C8J57DRAFT_1713166 [Mycena rebaudengoi]|nr:hypothetical protein C8J57DRAFT_1713166 [Mycena rebaudengoi]